MCGGLRNAPTNARFAGFLFRTRVLEGGRRMNEAPTCQPLPLPPKYGVLKVHRLNDLQAARFVHGSSNETPHKTHNLITTIPVMHLHCGRLNHKARLLILDFAVPSRGTHFSPHPERLSSVAIKKSVQGSVVPV